MQRISFSAVVAGFLAISAVVAAQQPPAGMQDTGKKDVTITGCVVKGDGGYLLTNVAETPSFPEAPAPTTGVAPVMPSAGSVVYWMSDEDKLKGHEGHRVQVSGELKGDVDKAEVEIQRKDGGIQVEAKADGKKVTALLPESSAAVGTAGAVGDKKTEINYLVRKFDVDSVKMIAATCQ